MAQTSLTNYFTPKRSARSAISEKRKLLQHHDDENIENCLSPSTKKRRICPTQPTEGDLIGCDLDLIEKRPLARKNLIDPAEKTVRSFDREKQRLADLVDLDEFREHLKNVRSQIDQVRGRSSPRTPVKNVGAAAHERFASLLVSPADLRQTVQNNETERLKKVLSKVDRSVLESLPTTPSKTITGVNQRLLEQIRLKEESRVQLKNLVQTGHIPDENQREQSKEIFEHFHQSVEILDQLFTTERQVALEIERIEEKFLELHSARLDREKAQRWIERLLNEFQEISPGYLTKLKLRNKEYLKINRMKFDGNLLKEHVQKKLDEFTI